jgi:deoxycytidine triphosphate deaminase
VASSSTAEEAHRAVLIRADALEEITGHLRGQLSPSRTSLHAALALVGSLPGSLRDVVTKEIASTTDPNLQLQILKAVLRHLNFVLDFVETYLAHGTRRELSEVLADEIKSELIELNVADHRVILSHGEANNYVTWYGDLSAVLFRPLGTSVPSPPSSKFALFRVPRLEGAGVQWRPILLGHEAAHVAVTAKDAVSAFDLGSKFDTARAGSFPNPKASPAASPTFVARALYQIAESWVTELICDLQALHRFGPAAIASLAEYFECIGAIDQLSLTHPPGLLRIRLLLDQLGAVGDSRLASILVPWADRVPPSINLGEPWSQYLADIFTSNLPALSAAVTVLATDRYDFEARRQWVHDAADRLAVGLPGRETIATSGVIETAQRADTVNAAWLARVEGALTPFDRLAQKTIESTDFVRNWLANGGQVPIELRQPAAGVDDILEDESGVAVLPADCLLNRMRLDDADKGLFVAPALHLPKGTGIDVRLGTRFIVFRRSATASFDPLDADDDPRAMQMFVELSPKERFVLHPNEVVLGATLEYLGIPDDLSGQVITRSSYGRLGLLSATAIQVHPGFRGCLTLELVNLSNIPISLTPGERIAQLVLWRTRGTPSSTEKYTHPIGPQFSLVRSDPEAETLRRLRS